MRLTLVNTRAVEITFRLEPWGDEHAMPAGARFLIIATGPNDGVLEIEYGEDHLTIWGWSGSIVQAFHEGRELGAGAWGRSQVPPVPTPGESV